MDPCRSLYVHVPFCAHKCSYCAFYSAPPSGDILQRYVDALIRELEMVAPRCWPRTVFFGGGTPSMLGLRHWVAIFAAMDRLGLAGAEEWTIECNPATVSADKARLFREHGVTRISMGVQSLDENLLDRLGRIHTRDQVFRSLEILRGAGFDNVNLDLMFAIPGQSMATWRSTLDETVAMETEHLSCYEVIYEEDTALFAQLREGKIEVDEELADAMFEELVDRAGNAGFVQYEVANFARNLGKTPPSTDDTPRLPDRACLHNVNYWRGGDFFGLGPSASEYLDGLRSKNRSHTEGYCQELAAGRRSKDYSEHLSPLARAGEIAAFGLRMNIGWSFGLFRAVTGFDLETHWSTDIQACINRGWGVATPEGFRLTREGLRFADAVAGDFLRPDNETLNSEPLPSLHPSLHS